MDFGKMVLKGFEKLINNRTSGEANNRILQNNSSPYAAAEESQSQPVDIQLTAEIRTNDIEPPPFQGEFAKTLFLWSLKKPTPLSKDTYYNSYLLWEGGIRNCYAYHQQLFAEGYFKPAEFKDLAENLKATDLKEILSGLGLPKSGKKADLVNRVIDHATIETLSKYYPEPVYVLSSLGEEYLETHSDYIEIHRHNWGFGYEEYDREHRDGERFEETAIRLMQKHITDDASNFGKYQYYPMYQAYANLGKDSEALQALLKVLYIDCSCAGRKSTFDSYVEGFYTKKDLLEQTDTLLFITPNLLDKLKPYASIYSDAMVEELYRWKLPVQVCTKDTFFQIVHFMMDGTGDERRAYQVLYWDYLNYLKGLRRK